MGNPIIVSNEDPDKGKYLSGGWIGVDFDGTLAYDHNAYPKIGMPIPDMVSRVKAWHDAGIEVRIVTARAVDMRQLPQLEMWLEKYLGFRPRITCSKDFQMIALYDDKAIQIIPNTGKRADGLPL